MVSDFTNILLNINRKAGLRLQGTQTKNDIANRNQKRFDQSCASEKRNLRSLGKKLSRYPDNAELRTNLHIKKKSFKKICRHKKDTYINNSLQDIDYKNSKKYGNNGKTLST